MIHVVICDDEEYTRYYLRAMTERYEPDCRITEFSSGRELLAYFKSSGLSGIDVLFLDIAMEDIDGMETAHQLRNIQTGSGAASWGSLPLIIFVTGYSDYMPQAFGVSAFGFIVKPVAEPEFEAVFKRACSECRHIAARTEKMPKALSVKDSFGRRTVAADEIVYIESMGHKVQLHLEDSVIELNAKIGDLEASLTPDFFRIHRGYLVNMKYVGGYDTTKAFMKNGDTVYISKYKFSDFAKAYMKFIADRNTVLR